jgi:hypothetical protein
MHHNIPSSAPSPDAPAGGVADVPTDTTGSSRAGTIIVLALSALVVAGGGLAWTLHDSPDPHRPSSAAEQDFGSTVDMTETPDAQPRNTDADAGPRGVGGTIGGPILGGAAGAMVADCINMGADADDADRARVAAQYGFPVCTPQEVAEMNLALRGLSTEEMQPK